MNAQTTRKRRVKIVRVAAAGGTALILITALVAAGSRDRAKTEPATSTVLAPRPCIVGTTGCGPLPIFPAGGSKPRPSHAPEIGVPKPGLLRPGTYDRLGFTGLGFHFRFTVPAGWRWDGHALSKGNAAIYFSLRPVLVYSDPCHWDRPQHPSVPWQLASPQVDAAALATQPMRYPTRPRTGATYLADRTWSDVVVIRLTVPSNLDVSRCDRGQYRTWAAGRNIRIAQGPGQRDLIAIAATSGRQLLVDAATFPDTPARLVRQVDAILASVGDCSCG